MNIAEVLCRHIATRPDAIAVWDVKSGWPRTFSFAALDMESARGAALLESHGLRAGDAVLIFQTMSAELYVVLIAIFRLGAIAIFPDPSAGREHVERCCQLWPPKALVAGARAHFLRLFCPALRRIPKKFVIGSALPGAVPWIHFRTCAPKKEILPCAPAAPALVAFTSGSTGLPKAAVRTHGFLLEQHRALEESLQLVAGEIDLTTLPIFVLANLASGVGSVIPDADLRFPGAIEPARIIAQLQSLKPTRTAASPAFFERLADHCAKQKLVLPELRKIFVGGAPVFPNLLKKLVRMAPQAEITAVYGSAEAEPIAEVSCSRIQPRDFESMTAGRGLLAGHPVPQIRLAVLEARWGTPIGPFSESEFQAAQAPVGVAGEIVVSGAHVLPGYLHEQGDSETKFDVGGSRWHRTGDAGYLDGQGRVWLLGRCEARIQDGRGILYPFSVECAAQQVSGVRRAALALRQGQRVLAVEMDAATGPANMVAIHNAVRWAEIDCVKILPKIPLDKRHNSKVNYPELRKLLSC